MKKFCVIEIKNDVAISNEVSIIRNNVCMEQFIPTFHLRLVYKQLINAFDQKVRDSYKRKNGPKWNQNGPEDLTDKLFDYPSYFERISRDFKKSDFTGIAFDEDRVDIKVGFLEIVNLRLTLSLYEIKNSCFEN